MITFAVNRGLQNKRRGVANSRQSENELEEANQENRANKDREEPEEPEARAAGWSDGRLGGRHASSFAGRRPGVKRVVGQTRLSATARERLDF